MRKQVGIPYMGSKRQLSHEIVSYIMAKNPNCKHFYDLFGGGGAISFQALQHKNVQNVYYNEIDTAIVELIKKIKTDGVTAEFYKWVDRETFHELKNGNDWYAGVVKTCWSFGNNVDKGYLFGTDIEKPKHLMHEVVVNRCVDSLDRLNELGLSIPDAVFNGATIEKRRLSLYKSIRERIDLQRLEQLQRLERLERLERLQQLERLELFNLSYEQVPITTPINETIIYCDPPYKGTGKYQNDIDHEAFLQWVKNSPYKIYVSSYDFDLPCVYEIKHRSSLSATNNSKKVVEKIFCNRKDNEGSTQLSAF